MKVHIVGGGFSGLTLAYFLSYKKNLKIVIHEQDHWGGCIQTLEPAPGARIELAANGFLASALFEEVSAKVGATLRGVSGSQGRYIFAAGKARRWPLSFLDSLRLVKFFVQYILFRSSVAPRSQESVTQWARRCLSETHLRALVEPALRGIYAGSADRLSASLILGKYFFRALSDSEGRSTINRPVAPRPVTAKQKGLLTGVRGMEGWLTDLIAYLRQQGVEFRSDRVIDLRGWHEDGATIVLATNPKDASLLLQTLDDERSKILENIQGVSLASVTLLTSAPPPLRGFGCLFPSTAPFHGLGVLFRQCFFPESGAPDQERWILPWSGETQEKLLQKVNEDRQRLWGPQTPAILESHVKLWPMALPLYSVELEASLAQLHLLDSKAKSQVILHGNYLGALGLTALLERSKQLAHCLVATKGW